MISEAKSKNPPNFKLASVASRIIAFIENIAILFLTVTIGGSILIPLRSSQPSFLNVVPFLLPFVLYLVVQAYLLSTRGQSLGKIHQNIKIVKYKNGQNGGFYRNVFLRVIIFRILLFFGFGIVHLIDLIMFFVDKEHRALHDKIAGTIVIINDESREKEIQKKYRQYCQPKILWHSLSTIILIVFAVTPFSQYITKGVLFLFTAQCNPQYLTCFKIAPLFFSQIYYQDNLFLITHFSLYVIFIAGLQFGIWCYFKKKK